MRRTVRVIFSALVLSLPAATGAAVSPAQRSLILAVHPYLPRAEIVARFRPLADDLSRAIDRPVEVRIGRDYAEHTNAIGTDSVDIAYMGPAPYVKLVAQYGKKPLLVRQEVDGQPFLRGQIIVRQDSSLRTLVDLKGKRFAFGDPDSTMGHVIPLQMLRRAGVPEHALANYKFLGAHKNVVLAVLAGDYDAGAVKEEVFQEFARKGLRSLATSPMVTDHLFVTSAKLTVALVDTLRRTLLQLNESPQGKVIMTAIHPNMTALAPARDGDYDSLRAILGKSASKAK